MAFVPDIVWRNPFPPTPRIPQTFSNLGADLWLVSYPGGDRVWFECVKGGHKPALRAAAEIAPASPAPKLAPQQAPAR